MSLPYQHYRTLIRLYLPTGIAHHYLVYIYARRRRFPPISPVPPKCRITRRPVMYPEDLLPPPVINVKALDDTTLRTTQHIKDIIPAIPVGAKGVG